MMLGPESIIEINNLRERGLSVHISLHFTPEDDYTCGDALLDVEIEQTTANDEDNRLAVSRTVELGTCCPDNMVAGVIRSLGLMLLRRRLGPEEMTPAPDWGDDSFNDDSQEEVDP